MDTESHKHIEQLWRESTDNDAGDVRITFRAMGIHKEESDSNISKQKQKQKQHNNPRLYVDSRNIKQKDKFGEL